MVSQAVRHKFSITKQIVLVGTVCGNNLTVVCQELGIKITEMS